MSADGRCRSCGYDLRGTAPGGVCPECSWAVDDGTLRTADPTWRAVIDRGCTLTLAGAAGGALVLLLTFVVPDGAAAWSLLLGGGSVAIAGVGAWQLTRAETGAGGHGRGPARVVRVTLITIAAVAVFWFAPDPAWSRVAALVTGILLAVTGVALVEHVQPLLERAGVPPRRRRRFARMSMAGLIIIAATLATWLAFGLGLFTVPKGIEMESLALLTIPGVLVLTGLGAARGWRRALREPARPPVREPEPPMSPNAT